MSNIFATNIGADDCWHETLGRKRNAMHAHVFFLYGFAKNEQSNIDSRETRALKELGRVLHDLSAEHIMTALDAGELLVLNDDDCT